MDPNTKEAEHALNHAATDLFNCRAVDSRDHSARAAYLLSDNALDLSCWDVSDIQAFLLSMVD